MKIYNTIDEFSPIKNAVVTIGTFDGVHKGHQKIIRHLVEAAHKIGGEVVLLTFFPHPRMVLFPDDHGLLLLNTLDEKIQLLEQFGVQHLIIHPFSKEFSRTSSTGFVRDLLVNKIGVKKLITGYDHHFGRNREGSFDDLQELAPVYNFEVEKIPEQDINDVAISSTKIRNALTEGDIKTANEFSGHPYSISGTVVHGDQRGRQLGFPTANIEVTENYKLIPANGVYAVHVYILENDILKKYKGTLNIGVRPTFDNGNKTIEVYILDFNDDIYGKKITVRFISRLRDEKKFNSVSDLTEAMKNDVAQTKIILAG